MKSELKYIQNSALKNIRNDWPGTPEEDGRFLNIEFPFRPKLTDVLKWKLGTNIDSQAKKKDQFRLNKVVDETFLSMHQDCIVWLGHSTFFIRLNNTEILIDPVFYDVPFVKRYSKHALSPAHFRKLDYLLISHDHQDHCQKRSFVEVLHYNAQCEVLTGLKMDGLLNKWWRGPVQCAGWYQQFNTKKDLEIYFLPSRHWSKRSINDDNQRLWGAFVLKTNNTVIYFSGDTGYGSHFKEVKELFTSIDVAIMGCGAFRPEWFMGPNHISPLNAVKAVNELKAKYFIPMHYGTFDLSDEPVGEPLRLLRKYEEQKLINSELKALSLGEVFNI